MTPSSPQPAGAIQFVPPEAVPITFVIAPVGARIGAQCLDLLFSWTPAFLLVWALVWSGLAPLAALITLAALLSFILRAPYYILSELIWNGQTPGKRLTGLRVINMNGRRLTPHQVTARNLMKEVEFFTPLTMMVALSGMSAWGIGLTLVWVSAVAITPLANRKRQRLGDMIAGTLVINNPKSVLLPDLAAPVTSSPLREGAFDFLPDHLNVYGRYELQTLEDLLRKSQEHPDPTQITLVARAIVKRTGYDHTLKDGEELAFLTAFYRAQREHLETLRLFGTNRDDKHHDGQPAIAAPN